MWLPAFERSIYSTHFRLRQPEQRCGKPVGTTVSRLRRHAGRLMIVLATAALISACSSSPTTEATSPSPTTASTLPAVTTTSVAPTSATSTKVPSSVTATLICDGDTYDLITPSQGNEFTWPETYGLAPACDPQYFNRAFTEFAVALSARTGGCVTSCVGYINVKTMEYVNVWSAPGTSASFSGTTAPPTVYQAVFKPGTNTLYWLTGYGSSAHLELHSTAGAPVPLTYTPPAGETGCVPLQFAFSASNAFAFCDTNSFPPGEQTVSASTRSLPQTSDGLGQVIASSSGQSVAFTTAQSTAGGGLGLQQLWVQSAPGSQPTIESTLQTPQTSSPPWKAIYYGPDPQG
jgi:hypothetical protein